MPDTTRSFKDQADLQGLTGDAIVELMILDLAPIDPGIDPSLRYVRFCNWNVSDGQPVWYGADQYVPLPFQSSGWQMKGSGVPPNPTVSLGNIGLEWSGLINTWEDLIGAKLTRRRVLARYLSTVAGSPRTDHWPDEIWFVQQKESENKLVVNFRLASAFDLDGIQLPRRRTLRYSCMWAYRGPECGYAGPPVADVNDEPWTTSGKNTPEWQAYESGLAAYRSATKALTTASSTLNDKLDILTTAQETNSVLIGEYYNTSTGSSRRVFIQNEEGMWTGTFNGDVVYRSKTKPDDNSEYQVGTYYPAANTYAIRRYTTDSAAINAATTAVTTATTAFNTAKASYDSAKATLAAADSALRAASADSVNIDVCGKRLQSCRLRFGNNATLPFGGFPGLYLYSS